MNNVNVNYASYLKLDQLLALQIPLSNPFVNDELIFIIVHQIHELSFKLLIQELKKVQNNFHAGDYEEACFTFRRCHKLVYSLEMQLQLLETMKPTEFAKFRSCLGSASGYQSQQYKELWQLFGFVRSENGLSAVSHTLSLSDSFICLLKKFDTQNESEVNDLVVHLYKNNAGLSNLFEAMIDFDLAMQAWRYQHFRLAERMIGSKQGTGGSAGVNYLEKAIRQKIFPLLWEVRNQL